MKHQYDLDPGIVIDKLHAQAQNLGRSLAEQLKVLRRVVPSFVNVLAEDLGVKIEK